MQPVILSWDISSNDSGIWVREFLLKVQGVSRRSLAAIKHHGGSIVVNGQPVTVRYELQSGDHLVVTFPEEEPSQRIKPEEQSLDIVFEDEHVLVLNKPPGIPTIPSTDHPSGTLANGVLFYYLKQGLKRTIHVVNRLDKDTSGLLIMAKHSYAHHLCSEQHKQGKIKRTYHAMVHGQMELDSGTVHTPIGRKSGSIIEREARFDGKDAITHYRVVKRFKEVTLISVQLETGRTHQIRVHMSHIGHPLLGDDLYGGRRDQMNRQALHSKELSFFHPLSNKEMVFSAELPDDMKMVKANLD